MQTRSISGCILSGMLRKQKYLILAKIRYNHCVLPPGGHAMKHRYHQAVTLLLLLMLLLQMASSSSAETLTKLGNSALRKAIKDSVYADWHIYQPTDMEISGKNVFNTFLFKKGSSFPLVAEKNGVYCLLVMKKQKAVGLWAMHIPICYLRKDILLRALPLTLVFLTRNIRPAICAYGYGTMTA